MKLNYTSLQHPVEPVEVAARARRGARAPTPPVARDPAARPPRAGRLGGGRRRGPGCGSATSRAPAAALPGALSRDVAELRERGLLCGHVTAGPGLRRRARGDQRSSAALDAAARRLGWDAVDRRARARDPRLGDPARPRRDGGARRRPRGARARAADAASAPRLSSADPRAAPPRAQPPHRDGARAAARAGPGPGARGRARGLAALGAEAPRGRLGRRRRSTT